MVTPVLPSNGTNILGEPHALRDISRPVETFDAGRTYINCRFEVLRGTGLLILINSYVAELDLTGNLDCDKSLFGKAQISGDCIAGNSVFEDQLTIRGKVKALSSIFHNILKIKSVENEFLDCSANIVQFNAPENLEIENHNSKTHCYKCRFKVLTGFGRFELTDTNVEELSVKGYLTSSKSSVGRAKIFGDCNAHDAVFAGQVTINGSLMAIGTKFSSSLKLTSQKNMLFDCYTKDITYDVRNDEGNAQILFLKNSLVRGDVKYFKQGSEEIQIKKEGNSDIAGEIIEMSNDDLAANLLNDQPLHL